MVSRNTALALALAALLAAAAFGGCGGGDEGSTATTTTSSQAKPPATTTTPKTAKGQKGGGDSQQPQPNKGTFVPKPHRDSGGGAAQFKVKGGDNSIQEFGAESSSSELEAAATALHGFLDARAARDWAAACSYLSSDVTKSFQQLSSGSKQLKGSGCAATLAALSKGVPTSTLAEAAQANVASLRSEGDRAFIVYRGAANTVYAISMEKQGGAWKVGSLSGVPLS